MAKTAKKRTNTHLYHFAVVVHGECCTRGHLWIQSHSGRTLKEATTRLLKSIRAQEYTPVEYAQLPSPTVIGSVEATAESEAYD